jgi:hypothetical protein
MIILYILNNKKMPRLVKQIVDELMEKFKNDEQENVIKIIREIRYDIERERIEQCNFDKEK